MFVEFCCRIDTCQVKRTWSFTVSCLWVSAEQQGCLHSGNVIDIAECPTFCIPVNTDVAQCDDDGKYDKDSDGEIKYLSSSFHLIMYLLNHYVWVYFVLIPFLIISMQSYTFSLIYFHLFPTCWWNGSERVWNSVVCLYLDKTFLCTSLPSIINYWAKSFFRGKICGGNLLVTAETGFLWVLYVYKTYIYLSEKGLTLLFSLTCL